MAKKDKFAQMQQGGGIGSFQETLVQAATTVAAIERQASPSSTSQDVNVATPTSTPTVQPSSVPQTPVTCERYTHLANPWISMREYNLASNYCNTFDNMTRMDWMELAIIEKLYHDGLMPEDEFNARRTEITSRPPRGMRKNTKVQKNR